MIRNFGFLLFNDFEDLDFAGPWEIISLWGKQFGGPQNIFTINEKNDFVVSHKNLTIKPHVNFATCPPLDYLLVVGGQGSRKEVDNPEMISFIKSQAKNCKNVLSVCTGAFLLQVAGLLDGKQATTHWASLDRLRAFKEVDVVEKRFTKDGNIWTSAGISAGIDMAFAFIAETASPEVAGEIQHYSEFYPDNTIYPLKTGKLPAYV